MIQIQVFQNQEGRVYSLQIKGHSLLSNAGTDILCAAISVLSENLANSLRAILNLSITIEEAKGLYMIHLDPDFAYDESDLLFASVILGYRVLAKQYPNRIEIQEHIENGT